MLFREIWYSHGGVIKELSFSYFEYSFFFNVYPHTRGGLVFEVGYHPRKKKKKKKKKNHVIRVVFQDQAMNVRTSFRCAKSCKIGEKKVCVFLIFTNVGKDMMEKLRKNMHKRLIRVDFYTW